MTQHIVGIDEVGRGPVAGPVATCTVWFHKDNEERLQELLPGMNDSKKVHVNKRRAFAKLAQDLQDEGILNYTIQYASAQEIDELGIMPCLHRCIERSMRIAKKDGIEPTDFVYLDGSLKAPRTYYKQKTVIGGDGKIFAISLASVIAKVARDEIMEEYGMSHPQYGFEQHKGYGTKEHMKMIREHGLSTLHRKTFLKKYIDN